MSKKMSRKLSRMNPLHSLVGLLAAGLCAPALFGQSTQYPTYVTGPQPNGSWVVSDGQVITPAGKQVDLGIRVRAKAVAVNPNASTNTAAVLTLGATEAVEIIDITSGVVLQNYLSLGQDSSGSYSGITYSADGKFLMFSQDSSNITIAKVDSEGLLIDDAQISVPPNNSFITCFKNSPPASYFNPCGSFYSGYTSYPGGIAISQDGKSAYALLNQNNTLAKIDLTQSPIVQGTQIRVGNAPHSILIASNGTTAYVSNEGGKEATANDFTINSAGTEIIADPTTGASITGTVSVVDLPSLKVTATIPTGLHPTGLAFWGKYLLVANAYSDSISVIDTTENKVVRTISLALPISVPGQTAADGAEPVSIAVDAAHGIAYVALYHANAIGVVNLAANAKNPIEGYIPVAYAPASVALDTNNNLIVANDKGIGTRNSFETDHGVTNYNTHQDNGTVSIVPVPTAAALATYTQQVTVNNHWDLTANIASAAGGSKMTTPVALPAHIGDPSLIKHVFLIVRENRTYDQILGDVAAGNGDPSLAVFGGKDTPNAHALIKRFPLFDNFYDPSRQSADGWQWISESGAPYADDIQSPDWVRSYPGGNAGDALAYQKKGFFWTEAEAAKLAVKFYGAYIEGEEFFQTGCKPASSNNYCEPSWREFYNDAVAFETGKESTLKYQNLIYSESSIPSVYQHLVRNFPPFDLGIPDQFRVDLWQQDFNKDLAANSVPSLELLWIMDDHTTGQPNSPAPDAQQADNDLAVGRIVDAISHSSVWNTSAIFIEEDDAQNGVDHVDGHRSPGYIVSPYVVQGGPTIHTYYTQVNMTRTIEQILGLTPLNQFDLVATPMYEAFVQGTPSADNFLPWTHVANEIPLDTDAAQVVHKADSPKIKALKAAWLKKGAEISVGKMRTPDSQDPDTVNHYNWYLSTDFTRPYPGEKEIHSPKEFTKAPPAGDKDGD